MVYNIPLFSVKHAIITFINITINSNYTISVKFTRQSTFISAENDHDFFFISVLYDHMGEYTTFDFNFNSFYNFSIVLVTVLMYI